MATVRGGKSKQMEKSIDEEVYRISNKHHDLSIAPIGILPVTIVMGVHGSSHHPCSKAMVIILPIVRLK